MKKTRYTSRRNWEKTRSDIETISHKKSFSSMEFRSLSIQENWKEIEEKIYHIFCKLKHPSQRPIWLWEYFKLDTFSCDVNKFYKYLDKVISQNEDIWFFVNGERGKFWFYEGRVEAIMTVVEESCTLDELYFASKKYQWLICVNHHNDLIVTGEMMPDRFRKLQITATDN